MQPGRDAPTPANLGMPELANSSPDLQRAGAVTAHLTPVIAEAHVFLALPESTLAITVTNDTRTGTPSASIEMWRPAHSCCRPLPPVASRSKHFHRLSQAVAADLRIAVNSGENRLVSGVAGRDWLLQRQGRDR